MRRPNGDDVGIAIMLVGGLLQLPWHLLKALWRQR